jgi:plasmid stabilization system protein ParE
MNKNVIWSSKAESDLANTLEYLALNWHKEVTISFLDILDQNISRILNDASQFPYFDKSANIRKCIITRHNTLYFNESISAIIVLRLYDVRQNPRKLQF